MAIESLNIGADIIFIEEEQHETNLFPKTVAQISTVQILIHDIAEIRAEESVCLLKPLFVRLDEGFKMILDATVIIGCLRISGPINGG